MYHKKHPSNSIRSIKVYTLLATLALLVSACSTNTYQQASSPKGYGYQDAALEPGRHRITFRGKNIDNAYDFALLRAAEVTLLEGHDWFRITDTISTGHGSRAANSRVSVGTGVGGRGYHSTRIGVGVGIPLNGDSQKVVQSFNIKLGSGEQPEGDKVYNAAAIKATISPRAKG